MRMEHETEKERERDYSIRKSNGTGLDDDDDNNNDDKRIVTQCVERIIRHLRLSGAVR